MTSSRTTKRPQRLRNLGAMNSAFASFRRWWGSTAGTAVSALIWTAVAVGGAYGEAHPRQHSDQSLNGHPVPHTPPMAFLLVGLAGLVLILRRRWPRTTLVVSTAAVIAYTGLGYVNGAALLLPAVALYAVATTVSVSEAVLWAGGTLVALMVPTGYFSPFGSVTGGGFTLIPALVAAGCFGGIAVANRRAYAASMAARAEEETRRRVDEERLRIARELHDVVAHTLATINVQAGVAAHLLADRPADPATDALSAIRDSSKQALAELRSILSVLRQADESDPVNPTPGLDQLETLVGGARRAGLALSVLVVGTRRPIPAAVDLAAYRIVQESLTNVLKHAGADSAEVRIEYNVDALTIEVSDTGRGAMSTEGRASSGHGLVGMAERAASVGGTFAAGPRHEGGFAVTARLPLQPLANSASGTVSPEGGAL